MHTYMPAGHTSQQPQLINTSSNPHFITPGMQIWNPPVPCICHYVFAGLIVVLNLQNNVYHEMLHSYHVEDNVHARGPAHHKQAPLYLYCSSSELHHARYVLRAVQTQVINAHPIRAERRTSVLQYDKQAGIL